MAILLNTNVASILNVTANIYTENIFVGNTTYNAAAWSGTYFQYVAHNANNFGGVAIQNRFATGSNGSVDFVAITDDGNDTKFYVDLGINTSGANDAVYAYLNKRDAYLLCAGNTTITSNLIIGTTTPGSNIQWIVGGNVNSNISMWLTGVPGGGANLRLVGNISTNQNIISTSNISAGNLSITQNTTTGNLTISTNLTASNATVNSISFIPVWTTATLNASYTALAGFNPPSFWQDPFGQVHIRGVLKPAANLLFSSILNVNIANGFPTTSNASRFIASAANDTLLGTNTAAYISWNICSNGAAQIILEQTIISGNLVYVSMDGIIYSKIGG
jgi:hypothetical protein